MSELTPAAVLWDMDGTLVNTEPYWFKAEVELVRSFGGNWTDDDGALLVGSGLWHSATILQASGVTLSADEIVNALTARVMEQIEKEILWRPGALELLAAVRAAGIPTALVTMSLGAMAEHVVARIPSSEISGTAFDLIVAGDTVTNSKPHPEAYLLAAKRLGVSAVDCIAIEDSVPGLASAVASGAVAIGVPLHSPLSAGNGYTIWPTLAGTTVADLVALFNSQKVNVA